MGRNLTELVNKSLSAGQQELIRRVGTESSARHIALYIVGGFVRDLLLGRPSLDFDLVIEGDAISLAQVLVEKYGGRATAHVKFGTAKINIREWRLGKEPAPEVISNRPSTYSIDLISSRSETYKHPAALPSVKMGTLADDLRRRDFSINSLAIRLNPEAFGELRDDLGGLEDLEKGFVRVLHPRSFLDDPTRMYRAVRYEQRFNFHIQPESLMLIPEARALVDKLSPQRIRHELELILEESNAGPMLARLAELDLLKPIHALLSFESGSLQRLSKVWRVPTYPVPHITTSNLGWLLWLMPLTEKQIDSLNNRLHFNAPLLQSLLGSSKIFSEILPQINWRPSQYVQRLDPFPVLAIYAVSIAAAEGKSKEALENYLMKWRNVMPKTTGHELKELGLKPGPRYQEILTRLRVAWLDGEIASETQEYSLLRSLL